MTSDAPPLHFSAAWFELGIVTPTLLEELQQEWARGEDTSPEHYRWRAFTAFVDAHKPLGSETIMALYALGAADADRIMGEAMMHRLVELPECPEDLLRAAESSGIHHLVNAAARRRARAPGQV